MCLGERPAVDVPCAFACRHHFCPGCTARLVHFTDHPVCPLCRAATLSVGDIIAACDGRDWRTLRPLLPLLQEAEASEVVGAIEDWGSATEQAALLTELRVAEPLVVRGVECWDAMDDAAELLHALGTPLSLVVASLESWRCLQSAAELLDALVGLGWPDSCEEESASSSSSACDARHQADVVSELEMWESDLRVAQLLRSLEVRREALLAGLQRWSHDAAAFALFEQVVHSGDSEQARRAWKRSLTCSSARHSWWSQRPPFAARGGTHRRSSSAPCRPPQWLRIAARLQQSLCSARGKAGDPRTLSLPMGARA